MQDVFVRGRFMVGIYSPHDTHRNYQYQLKKIPKNTNLTYRAAVGILHSMQFDLHVHTTISPCSKLTIEEIVRHAQARGLDGVCITDHNSMAVRREVQEGVQKNGLVLIFGMEYTTPEGDFLLFGPLEHLPQKQPATMLLRMVHEAGGVAIAAHPYRVGRQTNEALISQGPCQIIEGINGRNHHLENLQALNCQERFGTKLVGGSDAHSLGELGQVKTELQEPVQNRNDLIQCLKKGAFTLSQKEEAITLYQSIIATSEPTIASG